MYFLYFPSEEVSHIHPIAICPVSLSLPGTHCHGLIFLGWFLSVGLDILQAALPKVRVGSPCFYETELKSTELFRGGTLWELYRSLGVAL